MAEVSSLAGLTVLTASSRLSRVDLDFSSLALPRSSLCARRRSDSAVHKCVNCVINRSTIRQTWLFSVYGAMLADGTGAVRGGCVASKGCCSIKHQ